MAVEFNEQHDGRVLIVHATGKLSKADYEQFAPRVERLIEQFGKIRVLFEMHDFHGWDMGGLWEDIKFDARHFNHVERLAFVGDKGWQKGMSKVCRAFTTAAIRYFDSGQADQARDWIEAGIAQPVHMPMSGT